MPLARIGRYVAASPAELEGWLTREAGAKQTVHIPSENADLLADLKRALSEARKVRRKEFPLLVQKASARPVKGEALKLGIELTLRF